jgi:hypothetical protein
MPKRWSVPAMENRLASEEAGPEPKLCKRVIAWYSE